MSPILATRTPSWPIFLEYAMRTCALRYVGEVLGVKKLDFWGLKGQCDYKNANFRGLKAQIDHYRPIFASRTNLWPIFMEYAMGIVI